MLDSFACCFANKCPLLRQVQTNFILFPSLSLSVLAAPTPFAVFARLMRRQTAGLDYAESLARARAVLVRPVRRARDPLRKFSVSFC